MANLVRRRTQMRGTSIACDARPHRHHVPSGDIGGDLESARPNDDRWNVMT